MALTEEEKKELVQAVVNQIKTDSQSVDELEAVSTLDGDISSQDFHTLCFSHAAMHDVQI